MTSTEDAVIRVSIRLSRGGRFVPEGAVRPPICGGVSIRLSRGGRFVREMIMRGCVHIVSIRLSRGGRFVLLCSIQPAT